MGFRTNARVELNLGGTWTDITGFVFERDPITVKRGRSGNEASAGAGQLSLTLDNRDERFSPRNPMSPYYGMLSRNTPIRVSVPDGAGGRLWRFHGEVSKWPQTSALSSGRYVSLKAYGPRRRLTLNAPATRSAMYREHASPTRTGIVAYWPMEDGSQATQLAEAKTNLYPATITDGLQLANFSGWTASDALPVLNTGLVVATVPAYAATGEASTRMFCFVSEPPAVESSLLWIGTSTGARFDLRLTPGSDIRTVITNGDGVVVTSQLTNFNMESRGYTLLGLELEQVAADDVWWRVIVTDFANTDTVRDQVQQWTWEGTASGVSLGTVATVRLNRDKTVGQTAVGHLAVADLLTAYTGTLGPISAWNGEPPADRMNRLCGEEDVPLTVDARGTDDRPDAVTMGDQLNDTLVGLLDEAAASDGGILAESRDALALMFRTRRSLMNQDPRATLDYGTGEIAGDLNSVEDDSTLANDVTVSRVAGSSFRVDMEAGPLSVAEPPEGVGRYAVEHRLSLEHDGMLRDAAWWRLHLGTVDEARYPHGEVALHSPQLSAATRLALLRADIGDRLDFTGLGNGTAPDGVGLLVRGYTETLRVQEHRLTFNLEPESPFRHAVTDEPQRGRAAASGSVVAGPPATAPAFVNAGTVYANATSVTVPVPPGEDVFACLVWNTTGAIVPPEGWTYVDGRTGSSSRAAVWRASAGVVDSTFTIGTQSKFSVAVVSYDASKVHAQSAVVNSGVSPVPTAPAVDVGETPARVVRFLWDKATTTTSIVPDDWAATTRAVQYGIGGGACAVLTTDQVVSVPGTLGAATATTDTTAGNAGGFTVALVAAEPPEPVDVPADASEVPVKNGPDGILWTTDPADMPFDVVISGERMTVSDVSSAGHLPLNVNPYFAVDTSNWVASGGTTISRSTAVVHPNGVASLLIQPDGATATSGAGNSLTAPGSIIGGGNYTGVMWAYSPGGWERFHLVINWYDSTNTFLSSSVSAPTELAAGHWSKLANVFTAPAGASQAAIWPWQSGSPTAADYWYAWAVTLTPLLPPRPQTLTVTRAVNGISKPLPVGAAVQVANIARVGY